MRVTISIYDHGYESDDDIMVCGSHPDGCLAHDCCPAVREAHFHHSATGYARSHRTGGPTVPRIIGPLDPV